MAHLYRRSNFFRTSVLLWLSASLAGLTLGTLRIAAQTGATSPSQGGVTRREAAGAIVAQEQAELPTDDASSRASLERKHKRGLLKANLEKMRGEARELADLTKALQEELDKSNENVLALDIVEKADKIQKLAKKIKGNARGF